MIGCMGSAQTGSAEQVLSLAKGAVVGKLEAESVRDTLCGLAPLDARERQALRAIAEGRYTWGELRAVAERRREFKEGALGIRPELLAQLVICLCEEELLGVSSQVVRLQAPYASLLLSWITAEGQLAVAVEGDKIDLAHDIRKHLIFIWEHRTLLRANPAAREAASAALLASLARNRIGTRLPDGGFRSPETAAEFDAISALTALRGMLSVNYLQGVGQEPSLHRMLRKAAEASTPPDIAAAGEGDAAAGGSSAAPAAPPRRRWGWPSAGRRSSPSVTSRLTSGRALCNLCAMA